MLIHFFLEGIEKIETLGCGFTDKWASTGNGQRLRDARDYYGIAAATLAGQAS